MHKAQKEMRKVLSGIDVMIEVLDARIPASSQNPMITEIRGELPCIQLLHKADIADSERTTLWLNTLQQQPNTSVLLTDASDTAAIKRIPVECRKLCTRNLENRPVHALIVGIPNVGKSTLINKLAGKIIAKTGNEPAVTRSQQRVDIGSGVVLRDTPGVLWANLENHHSGYRLAVTGAIKDTAIDSADVALYALEFLQKHYPSRLMDRYFTDSDVAAIEQEEPITLLDRLGQKRGCIGGGGLVDYDRAGKLILQELRSGLLGRFTLETPDMLSHERQEVEQRRLEKAAKKSERQQRRKKSRK